MATFPLIKQFDDERPIGHVVIPDEVAEVLAANAEYVELVPMLAADDTIKAFGIFTLGEAFVTDDENAF